MAGGIVGSDAQVMATGDDLAFVDNDGSNRDLSAFEGALRGAQSLFHVEFVGHRDSFRAGCCWVMQCMAPKPQTKSPL